MQADKSRMIKNRPVFQLSRVYVFFWLSNTALLILRDFTASKFLSKLLSADLKSLSSASLTMLLKNFALKKIKRTATSETGIERIADTCQMVRSESNQLSFVATNTIITMGREISMTKSIILRANFVFLFIAAFRHWFIKISLSGTSAPKLDRPLMTMVFG